MHYGKSKTGEKAIGKIIVLKIREKISNFMLAFLVQKTDADYRINHLNLSKMSFDLQKMQHLNFHTFHES